LVAGGLTAEEGYGSTGAIFCRRIGNMWSGSLRVRPYAVWAHRRQTKGCPLSRC